MPVADRTIDETYARFWGYVEKTESCWIWQGVLRRGYGRFKIRGVYYSAHRLAYEWLVGPIPEGLTVDHGEHCSNRACVNPEHFDLVTLGENTARSNRRRTGWKCAHSFTPDNIYTDPRGRRLCRACRRAYRLTYRANVVARGGERQTDPDRTTAGVACDR